MPFRPARPRIWQKAVAVLTALLLLPTLALAGEMLPDIAALPPEDISLEVTPEGKSLLRFTQKFANVGTGVLRVDGEPTDDPQLMQGYQIIEDEEGTAVRSLKTSTIIFHPHHKHWHAGDVASYELHQGAPWGPLIAKNGKISYCLVDEDYLDSYEGKYHPPTYLNCEQASQGLNPGYVDVYEAHLHDQWIDVTNVPDGVYHIVIQGDPHHVYLEADAGDWSNNTATVKVELTDGATKVRVMPDDEIILRVDGKRPDLPVYSRIRDGVAMGHIRLAESLGATVTWNGTSANVATPTALLEIIPGKDWALVNGVVTELPAPAVMENDRILIPIRFLAENLGAKVSFDWLTATVDVTTK